MKIVKEISELSREVERLSDMIERYGDSVNKVSAVQDKLGRLFGEFSKVDFASMSVEELAAACTKLSRGYAEVEKTQNEFIQQEQDVQDVISKRKQLLSQLGEIRKDAMAEGDAHAVKDYTEQIANENAALQENVATIQQVKGAMSELEQSKTQLNATSVRLEILSGSGKKDDELVDIDEIKQRATGTAKFVNGAFEEIANKGADKVFGKVNTELSRTNEQIAKIGELLGKNKAITDDFAAAFANIKPVTAVSSDADISGAIDKLTQQQEQLNNTYESTAQRIKILTELTDKYREGRAALYEAQASVQAKVQKDGKETDKAALQSINQQIINSNKQIDAYDKTISKLQGTLSEIKNLQTGVGRGLEQALQVQDNKKLFNFDASKANADELVEKLGEIQNRIRTIKAEQSQISTAGNEEKVKSLTQEKESTEKNLQDLNSGKTQGGDALKAAYQNDLNRINAELKECATQTEQAKAKQEEYNAQLQQLNGLADACSAQLKKLGADNPFDVQSKSVEELNKLIKEERDKLGESVAAQAKIKETIVAAQKEQERVNKLSKDGQISEEAKNKILQEQNQKIQEAKKLLEQQQRIYETSKAKISAYQDAANAPHNSSPQSTHPRPEKNMPRAENLSASAKAATELSKGLAQVKNGFIEMGKGGAPAVAGLQMVASGIKAVGKALASLMLNPWVLLISAVVSAFVLLGKALSSFFTKTEEGQAKFAKFQGVFNGVKATIEQFAIEVGRKLSEIGDLLISCGKLYVHALSTPIFTIVTIARQGIQAVKNAFQSLGKRDFQGALDGLADAGKQMKQTFSDWNKEFATTAQEIKDNWNNISSFHLPDVKGNVVAYQQLQQDIVALTQAQQNWEKESAKLNAQISAVQETMYSGSRTEQLDAAENAQGLINEKYNKEIALAKEDLRIKKEIVSVAGKNKTIDQINAQNDAESRLFELETKRNNELRTMARRYKSLQDAIANQQKQQEQTLKKQSETNNKQARDNAYQADLSILQQQLKYETDITRQKQLRQKISELTLEHELQGLKEERKAALEQLEIDKKADIRTNYGDSAVREYENTGKLSKDSQGLLNFYDNKANGINTQYDLKEQGVSDSTIREQEKTEFDKRLENFTSYLDQTITLEEQYQKRLADIRAQYGLAEDSDLSQYGENTAVGRDVAAATVERDRAQAIVNRDTNIGGEDTKWVEDLANLGADVAGKAMEEVRAIYDQFIAEVEKQTETTTQARDTAQANVNAEKDFQATASEQIQGIDTQLAAGTLPPEEQQALLEQRATLEQQIAESKERQAVAESAMTGSQQNLNQLTQVRAKAESAAANATDSASTKSQKKMQATKRTTSSLADAFAAVKESADAIADTFGGVLSQKAKKALGTMSDVASFGEQTINSIASLTQGTMKGMSMSAFMAAESISTVEKASVILTIISMAVQAVMAIVKIASQFTESAQMQEAIDAQTEKVDNLKRRHQDLEREYKDKSGTEYYKGLAKSAKDYDNIIAAQTKAVQQANELYQRQKEKYGEDSDKAKEAKEQLDDLKDDNNDLIDSQREQYNQLLEDLSGTNLQSFSESLADALIDGFAQGKEGISDVWEDTMDDLMRTMMKQQLALAIQDMFQGTFDKLNNMTKDGELTQSEIDSIMSEFDAQSEKAKYLAEKYYDLMSERGLLDDADAEGSQGFGQMTQDTADALNARFTALQIEGANVVEAAQSLVTTVSELGADSKLQVASLQTLMYNSGIALQVAQEQLDQLQVIADNTALLADTNDRLKAIQQNTSRL